MKTWIDGLREVGVYLEKRLEWVMTFSVCYSVIVWTLNKPWLMDYILGKYVLCHLILHQTIALIPLQRRSINLAAPHSRIKLTSLHLSKRTLSPLSSSPVLSSVLSSAHKETVSLSPLPITHWNRMTFLPPSLGWLLMEDIQWHGNDLCVARVHRPYRSAPDL